MFHYFEIERYWLLFLDLSDFVVSLFVFTIMANTIRPKDNKLNIANHISL